MKHTENGEGLLRNLLEQLLAGRYCYCMSELQNIQIWLPWFQTFAMSWMLYAFFWVIPMGNHPKESIQIWTYFLM